GQINGDVTATPAVVDGTLYFPDWAGNLHAVDAETGAVIWKKFLPSDYSLPGKFMFFSRTTPAVSGDTLIIGSKKHLLIDTCPQGAPMCVPNDGAVVAAVDRHSGDLLWSTLVDPHPAAQITGSPVIYGDVVIVPVSSWEEEFTISSSAAQFGGDPTEAYPCCSFIGSVAALDLETGDILWQTYMAPGDDVPDGILAPGEIGYYGSTVYSGSPSVDPKRNQVYVSTGNNYIVPEKAKQCAVHMLDPGSEPAPDLPPGFTCENLNEKVGNQVDAMVALDLDTGAINWSFRAREYDPWVHACAFPDFYLAFFPPLLGATSSALEPNLLENCTDLPGPDYGFGQSPMLIENVRLSKKHKVKKRSKRKTRKSRRSKRRRTLVGAGEKSGIFYALDPDDGSLVWKTQVGPGGVLGGMQWGSATDGRTIFTANTNANNSSRDRTKPFFPNPLNPIYPGYPGDPFAPPCVPFGDPCPYSGPGFPDGSPNWKLVRPPKDVQVDDVSTYKDEQGKLRTITGFWSALDAATGRILWQRPLPTDGRPPIDEFIEADPMPGTIHGSVTLAGGVLFGGGNFDGQGLMVGLDAKTGRQLWQFNAQFEGRNAGGIESSPAVVNGAVYWGAGASRGGILSTPVLEALTGLPGLSTGGAELRGNKVYSFELPGK
ncbi:MAG: PQQ-binding-like beta-propeller repeat protein, partial [Proteobacteria bacterium]|nr:PQQ-binding-like beta-propeller repeat protein [Pseudomonadota bacterium]